MKTVLSLLALSFLSTACGAVETDGGGSYRMRDGKTEYCLKGDGGCYSSRHIPAEDKPEPDCLKPKAKPTVVVFNIVSSSDEDINECEKEVSK